MEKSYKILQILCCKTCDYSTCYSKDYKKHLLTGKHQNRTKLNHLEQKVLQNPTEFVCKVCQKSFKARNSLWYHEQKCKPAPMDDQLVTVPTCDKDLIVMLIKQNAQLMEQNTGLMEMVKQGTHHTTNHINTNNTNSHNNAFNLNFFLNETCKNAMNITDFVDSIKLQLSDFIEVGELGYVEGISKIIVKNLNALDETERPVHCTDKKRETFYIKDANKWEKEDEDMKRIKGLIKKVAFKNTKMMPLFKEKYTDYMDSSSKHSDQYSKTVIEAMGGAGNNDKEKELKIIRNISNATLIRSK
jgi:hypothetical protein